MRSADVISVIESVYDVERPRTEWLNGVLASISTNMPGLIGAGGLLYRIDEQQLIIDASATHAADPEWLKIGRAAHGDPQTMRGFVNTYRTMQFADMVMEGRRLPNRDGLRSAYRDSGLGSCFLVNGYDPAGFGCAVYLFAREDAETSARRGGMYRRVATHLATAYRLLRRLEVGTPQAPPAAVLDEHGATVQPAGDAEAARAISAACAARQQARGDVRLEDPTRALSMWRAMVTGRWTLVDKVERDGRRFIVAEENGLPLRGVEGLAPRERAVLALAAAGRVNKIIAYELGIAPATVRVLLARASTKLGVRSRAALIERYRLECQ